MSAPPPAARPPGPIGGPRIQEPEPGFWSPLRLAFVLLTAGGLMFLLRAGRPAAAGVDPSAAVPGTPAAAPASAELACTPVPPNATP